MKSLRHLHIDFAQPQRALFTAQRLFASGVLLALLAAGFIALQLDEIKNLRTPTQTSAPMAEPVTEVPASYRDTLRALNQDLDFLGRSVERPLPAGITLLALTASADSGDVLLTVQANSAEKILALPAWLEPDIAQRQWKVEQMSSRSGHAVLTGVLSCSRCAQR